jgi:hypothetical protein
MSKDDWSAILIIFIVLCAAGLVTKFCLKDKTQPKTEQISE